MKPSNNDQNLGQGKRPDQLAQSEAVTTAGWMILFALFFISVILYLIN